jgi:hypothetical protein
MKLGQVEAHDVVAVGRIVSATLQFDLGVLSDEVPDGQNDDGFVIAAIDQDNKVEPISAITEESAGLELNKWVRWQITDFAQYVVQREGWETMRLQLRSLQNDSSVTQHLLDNVSLTVCQSTGPFAVRARQSGRQPALVGRTLPGAPLTRMTLR